MKRLNPATGLPFKRGDVREDGYKFRQYDTKKPIKKDGHFNEVWISPTVFEKELARVAAWHQSNPEKVAANKNKWYQENREKMAIANNERRLANPEKTAFYSKTYRKKHPEKIIAYSKAYREAYPEKNRAKNAKRRAAKLQRTPKWLTQSQLMEIAGFYAEAQRLFDQTGIIHHVDHIIPLQGEFVSGLHVPWNLQVLTATENLSKSNKLATT
jgi:5-methylcytosine-specific restriction endonuclease McrA